eukprot:2175629-Amphidinium_carterae.1
MAQGKSYARALTGEPRARLPGPPKRPPAEATETEAQQGSGQPSVRLPRPPERPRGQVAAEAAAAYRGRGGGHQ